MCGFGSTGTFCSTPCKSCDQRMRWRSRETRIRQQRQLDRLMRGTAR